MPCWGAGLDTLTLPPRAATSRIAVANEDDILEVTLGQKSMICGGGGPALSAKTDHR